MDAKQLQTGRIGLFRSAARFEPVDRVPYFSSAVTWKVFHAGHTLDEAMTDYAVMEECVRAFLDAYPVDGLLDYGIRNQFGVTETLGPGGYYYYTPEAIAIRDHAHCTPETLKDFLADPARYTWETVLPAKYGDAWRTFGRETWKRAFKAYMDYTAFIIRIGSAVRKDYGVPSMAPNNPMKGAISFGIEELLANLLGIKQLSIAMRRNKEEVESFVRAWDEARIDPIVETVKKSGKPDESYCFDASVMMLAQNVLNPKQFETLYWPSLEKLLDAYAEKHMNVRIFAEGSILRYAEYFRKYPKGTLTFHIEADDPFAFREALPNAAIMGGLTTDLLANGTPEECVRRCGELADGLGAKNGGFIFSENKMLSYANDVKPENLAAVVEYVTGRPCKADGNGIAAAKEKIATKNAAETENGGKPQTADGAADGPARPLNASQGDENPYVGYPEGYKRFSREIVPFYLKPMSAALLPLFLQILRDG